ncbi:hypothetical protein ACFLUF_00995 [Chloroflexota bacterium]
MRERESSVAKVKTLYGSLTIRECKFCGGEAMMAKGRYKTYMFCSHCDKVYKVNNKKL